jgi:hypothetical protein
MRYAGQVPKSSGAKQDALRSLGEEGLFVPLEPPLFGISGKFAVLPSLFPDRPVSFF